MSVEKAKQFFPTLTKYRAVAALMVAVYHALLSWPLKSLGFISKFGSYGWIGVGFFFALSGFVLTSAHISEAPIDVRNFYFKRFARIYPMHLVTFAVAIFFYELSGKSWAGFDGPHSAWLLNLVLLQDWVPHNPGIRQSLNGVSWTLSCELFFYLLAPGLITRMRNLSFVFLDRALIFCIVTYVALSLIFSGNGSVLDLLYFWPPIRIIEFFAGCQIAFVFRRGQTSGKPFQYGGILWICAAVVCQASLNIHNDPLLASVSLPGFLAIIYGAATTDKNSSHSASSGLSGVVNRFFFNLGEASFVFYMIHVLVLVCVGAIAKRVFGSEVHHGLGAIFIVFFLTSSTVASFLIYRFFDRPVHARLVKFYRDNQKRVAANSAP